MHIVPSILLLVSSAFAYQVTSPGGNQGWNTTGPNVLEWERVDTDPLNFTAVLTNVNSNSNTVLISLVDGTLGSVVCPEPSTGWPTGSGFRVNLAQDASNLDSLLAQSSEFNITAVSSSQSTTSATSTTTPTGSTSQTASLSSSDTSTTPTGSSAAPRGMGVGVGWLAVVGALTTVVNSLF